jgi:succinoglycan biosynthesis protein ExoM
MNECKPGAPIGTISVCIATHRRPDRLAALLGDLCGQSVLPDEVVVVDNDAREAAAGAVVEAIRPRAPFTLRYAIEPVKNIALARNRSVALASGDWLAFVDDDERAPREWLERLANTAAQFKADGVLGPVEPQVPPSAPDWIRRGTFYDWPRTATGTVVPPNRLRFGNVLLGGALLHRQVVLFDPAYGITGGEDGDLLARLAGQGARIVWCDEAAVHEPVESARLNLRWLLRRSLRGGQDFARHSLAGRYAPNTRFRSMALFVRSLAQLVGASLLALLLWPLGRHRGTHWLLKAAANFGRLTVFWGWHYREYA